MKKVIYSLTIIVLSLLLWLSLAYAQQEKNPTWQEKYSDRSILIISSKINVELKDDWSVIKKTYYKIKIQKEDAKSLGEITINYDKSREKIVDIKAYTITPDGKKYRYSKIQDFQSYKGFPMYSDVRTKIITMPEVNVGSIIEYEYTRLIDRMPIKNQFWYVTSVPPGAIYGEFKLTVILPKKCNVRYKEFNLAYKPKVKEDDSRIIYNWHLKEIDNEQESEDYEPLPNIDSVVDCVEFSSIGSWRDISDWYDGLIRKNMVVNRRIRNKVNELIEGRKTTNDKVRAILQYIQDNFRYVSMSFGDHAYEPHQISQVFRNKYGDCKDLSLLTMAMLKFSGIKSHMALFNDEFSITDPQYDLPYPSIFDHALLLVKGPQGNDFYIDPQLDGYDIGQYPLEYQGAYTFIITEDGGRFGRFPIFDEKKDYSKTIRTITIYQDGSALQEAKVIWRLDLSVWVRYMINAMNTKDKEKFYQKVENSLASGGKVLEHRIEGLDSKYGPLKSYIKTRRPNCYPITDDMIIIDISGYERTSDFTEDQRKSPIFYPENSLKEVTTTYHLPDGFRASYIPKNLNLDIGFFSFKREYKTKKDEIVVSEITRHRRLELPKEDYKKVKNFFSQLPQKSKQRIVLKRIKPWWKEIGDKLFKVIKR